MNSETLLARGHQALRCRNRHVRPQLAFISLFLLVCERNWLSIARLSCCGSRSTVTVGFVGAG